MKNKTNNQTFWKWIGRAEAWREASKHIDMLESLNPNMPEIRRFYRQMMRDASTFAIGFSKLPPI